VPELQSHAETQARRLLRFLFLRQRSLSADPDSTRNGQGRMLRMMQIEFERLKR
jgi:hypothetical protein